MALYINNPVKRFYVVVLEPFVSLLQPDSKIPIGLKHPNQNTWSFSRNSSSYLLETVEPYGSNESLPGALYNKISFILTNTVSYILNTFTNSISFSEVSERRH